jgi:hypothetical protein
MRHSTTLNTNSDFPKRCWHGSQLDCPTRLQQTLLRLFAHPSSHPASRYANAIEAQLRCAVVSLVLELVIPPLTGWVV